MGLSPSANYFCCWCTVNRKSKEMYDINTHSPERNLNTWKIGKLGVQVLL